MGVQFQPEWLSTLLRNSHLDAVATPMNQAILSTTLANLNRFDEALEYIDEALKSEPQNLEYARLRRTYTNKLQN